MSNKLWFKRLQFYGGIFIIIALFFLMDKLGA
ncbi:hypothetical protein SPV1_03363 [Mariprofundus ferrooxydans PV-1]|uniref:Uncharacterized protein n=1 Tax=Mariprofundus ferrooxydans PV-1 TaxID=314345 RepID=Q0EXK4_9PROT|nr:hypothetical protein SPV1_03363 [Mariprofundus ferrooxydans PV-1]